MGRGIILAPWQKATKCWPSWFFIMGNNGHYILHDFQMIRTISGWWFGTWMLFFHILGMSSSQLNHQPETMGPYRIPWNSWDLEGPNGLCRGFSPRSEGSRALPATPKVPRVSRSKCSSWWSRSQRWLGAWENMKKIMGKDGKIL
jgi:hypothetical protein